MQLLTLERDRRPLGVVLVIRVRPLGGIHHLDVLMLGCVDSAGLPDELVHQSGAHVLHGPWSNMRPPLDASSHTWRVAHCAATMSPCMTAARTTTRSSSVLATGC